MTKKTFSIWHLPDIYRPDLDRIQLLVQIFADSFPYVMYTSVYNQDIVRSLFKIVKSK